MFRKHAIKNNPQLPAQHQLTWTEYVSEQFFRWPETQNQMNAYAASAGCVNRLLQSYNLSRLQFRQLVEKFCLQVAATVTLMHLYCARVQHIRKPQVISVPQDHLR